MHILNVLVFFLVNKHLHYVSILHIKRITGQNIDLLINNHIPFENSSLIPIQKYF